MPIKPRTKKPTLSQFGDYLEGLHERQKKWRKRTFYFSSWRLTDACKTHACAIGWGIIEKQLPGMSLNIAENPVYDGEDNLYAVASYFGIGYKKAKELFTCLEGNWSCPSDEVTALDVSKAIKEFLKERKTK